MESLKNIASDHLNNHQTLYKLKTPPWKETFRQKCYQRLKDSRARLVDKFRGLKMCSDETFDVLMKEDWKTLSKEKNSLFRCFFKTILMN
ncbi:RPA_interact_N domain-containing protein [Caerostris extrusa]|uniref:RPA_interact_N domain-containing protein n=1 Tax=Caerostris extrusa TaxID=172846 RepID=A0AAV4XIL9_CAEEX|nr:RPA_interact_N domain-containing protein [Caerostris extrusa]